MNRRSFFRALAATAVVTLAAQTRLGHLAPRVWRDEFAEWSETYAEALAASMLATRHMVAANVLNRAFEYEEVPYVEADDADRAHVACYTHSVRH